MSRVQSRVASVRWTQPPLERI